MFHCETAFRYLINELKFQIHSELKILLIKAINPQFRWLKSRRSKQIEANRNNYSNQIRAIVTIEACDKKTAIDYNQIWKKSK